MFGYRSLIVAACFVLGSSCAAPASACPTLDHIVDTPRNASDALLDCIKRTPAGGRVELGRGTYVLRKQLRITKPVVIATAGITDSAPNCDELGEGACATLLSKIDGEPNPNIMPIEIVADGIGMTHLVIRGSAEAKTRHDCTRPDRRPLGGGLRVLGSDFTLRKSSLRGFTCYTTMEVLAGVKRLRIEDNVVGPNGDHRPGNIWTDGITILDGEDSIVRNNRFIDNTDVQLILGGCRRCRVEGNIFRHSGPFKGASFAELMLQAFPSTTGDYWGRWFRATTLIAGRPGAAATAS
jgi:hypothetical protein